MPGNGRFLGGHNGLQQISRDFNNKDFEFSKDSEKTLRNFMRLNETL